jgi:hypothetical protein
MGTTLQRAAIATPLRCGVIDEVKRRQPKSSRRSKKSWTVARGPIVSFVEALGPREAPLRGWNSMVDKHYLEKNKTRTYTL